MWLPLQEAGCMSSFYFTAQRASICVCRADVCASTLVPGCFPPGPSRSALVVVGSRASLITTTTTHLSFPTLTSSDAACRWHTHPAVAGQRCGLLRQVVGGVAFFVCLFVSCACGVVSNSRTSGGLLGFNLYLHRLQTACGTHRAQQPAHHPTHIPMLCQSMQHI